MLVITAFLNVGRVELYWEVVVGCVLGWCLEAAGRVRSCARELATLECGFRAAGGSRVRFLGFSFFAAPWPPRFRTHQKQTCLAGHAKVSWEGFP